MASSCGNPKCATAPAPTSLQLCSRCRKTSYCSADCQKTHWNTHKSTCVRPNYIIKFHLAPEHITNPSVTRTLSCPADAPFYLLHMILQIAFGWATTHSFDFAVVNPDYRAPEDMFQLIQQRMAMDRNGGIQDASAPQEYLFRVIDPMKANPFSGVDKMHEGPRRHPNTPEKNAEKYKLWQLLDDPKYQGKKITYTYDFGDNWDHFLTVTGRSDATRTFVCLEGEGHYVAEDCRGVNGWEDLKKAYRAERPSSEQRQRREWFEKRASNKDPLGLAGDRVNHLDLVKLNRDLENVFEIFEQKGEQNQEQLQNVPSHMRSAMTAALGLDGH